MTGIRSNCLSEFLTQDRINRIPKTLITCLDFGITEPAALQYWGSLPNTIVRVAGAICSPLPRQGHRFLA